MKLYWAPRTRSFRALWMMEEAGLPYERELIDIRSGAQQSPEYRAINPMMKVPALADGEAVVSESAAICAYVADKAPEAGLAPGIGDPARGAYLKWLFFSAGCVEPSYLEKAMGLSITNTAAAGWGNFDRVMGVLDEALRSGPWILGGRFSAADVMLGSDLHFGMAFKLVEPRPSFETYVARCRERPAYARAAAIEEAGA